MNRRPHDLCWFGDKIANAVLFPFGRCRIRVDDWPHENVDGILARIKERQGVFEREEIPLFLIRRIYFRVGVDRVTLTFLDDDDVFLSGPKTLVRDLASRIAA
jgi:hypothetical protein